MAERTVDGYIAGLPAEQQEIAREVVALVGAAAPTAKLSIKWAQPVWESNGPFAYLKAFRNHVNFGFWRGFEVDTDGLLESGGSVMKHIKLRGVSDIDGPTLQAMVRRAVELNATKGDPTKRR
jgi:hypothetical protein